MSAPTSIARFTVRAAVAPLLGDARISTSLTSQLLAGEVVDALEVRGDWYLVRAPDGYEGWTHRGYLTEGGGSEAEWATSLGVTVQTPEGLVMPLPLGARVNPAHAVIAGEALTPAELRARFPKRARDAARTAETLFRGASYLWAGVTPWGCDCSGLVQRAFALHGIALPRDAWQQASEGDAVSGDAGASHEAGDLLFFTDRDDRRVTHVGIALGDARMVHSALTRGGVAVEQMNGDDDYVARLRANCTGVRRVR